MISVKLTVIMPSLDDSGKTGEWTSTVEVTAYSVELMDDILMEYYEDEVHTILRQAEQAGHVLM